MDFDGTGTAVIRIAPVVSLSRYDLVAALLMADVPADELVVMSVEQIRHEVAFILAGYGLLAVHETVFRERDRWFVEAEDAAYTALCESRINEAFGLTPASRPRAAARSIGARPELATVAA
ncbi:hypothetical protein [Actinoplanes subtropicus]|uniref:hypothetical protein n=1 Tax=Actinoplanes subtropicus TaxID=543632 RepID=UPI0012FAB1D7|nr:hypothetical protein [Actinoplanes subtropicus]